jgi:hypothetical protein
MGYEKEAASVSQVLIVRSFYLKGVAGNKVRCHGISYLRYRFSVRPKPMGKVTGEETEDVERKLSTDNMEYYPFT